MKLFEIGFEKTHVSSYTVSYIRNIIFFIIVEANIFFRKKNKKTSRGQKEDNPGFYDPESDS